MLCKKLQVKVWDMPACNQDPRRHASLTALQQEWLAEWSSAPRSHSCHAMRMHVGVLSRMKDVGKSKANIAAERIVARIGGAKVTPHFCRIEDQPLEFFQGFHIWVLGLDSLDARRYMNQIACSFLGSTLQLGGAASLHRRRYPEQGKLTSPGFTLALCAVQFQAGRVAHCLAVSNPTFPVSYIPVCYTLTPQHMVRRVQSGMTTLYPPLCHRACHGASGTAVTILVVCNAAYGDAAAPPCQL